MGREKEEKIIDFKDYVPPKIEEFIFKELVLEDIAGTKFKFKFRMPTTSEYLRLKRESEDTIIVSGSLVSKLKYEELFTNIASELDALPKIKADVLKPKSIEKVVATFLTAY